MTLQSRCSGHLHRAALSMRSLCPAGALLLAVVGDREAWSQEGALQLPAEACFENATALRACNGLRSPSFPRPSFVNLKEPVQAADRHPVNAICTSAISECTALTGSRLPIARCQDLLLIILRSGELLELAFDSFRNSSNLPNH